MSNNMSNNMSDQITNNMIKDLNLNYSGGLVEVDRFDKGDNENGV